MTNKQIDKQEERALKRKIFNYIDSLRDGELDRLIYAYYKIAGKKGLEEFIRDYNMRSPRPFPVNFTSAYRIAMIEKHVSQYLPWNEYPHITKNMRRRLFYAENRELLINQIIKGKIATF